MKQMTAKVAKHLPSGEAVTLPEVGHIGAFLASEQVLPHALRVLREGLRDRPWLQSHRRGERCAWPSGWGELGLLG